MTAKTAYDEPIKIAKEQVVIETKAVETGRVRVRTVTDVRDEVLSQSLQRHGLSVERHVVEQEVSAPPPPREEDGCTIISIIEERPILTKAMFVVEEIIIRHTVSTEEVETPVSLRSMRAIVEADPEQS